MAKQETLYQKLLLVFQKHDVLDCYSLSYGKETYSEEVKYLMKKIRKSHDYSRVRQSVSQMFNEFLDLSSCEIKGFAFKPEDFEELSEDIFKAYQGLPINLNIVEADRLRCEELCLELFGILEDLDKSLEELESELDLGDGMDIECLSYPELDQLVEQLAKELNKLEED